MLSMAAMVDRKAGKEMSFRAGFDIGRETFRGALVKGRWVPERGAPEGDAIFAGTANALAPVIYGARKVADWAGSGAVTITGDLSGAQRFVDLFRLT